MLEKVAEKTNRARIITKAEVFKLLQNGRNVVGCEYRKAGKVVKDCKIQTDIFRRILCHPWKGWHFFDKPEWPKKVANSIDIASFWLLVVHFNVF